MCRRLLKILVPIYAFINHQVLGQHFAIHALPRRARPRDRRRRILGGHMNDINRQSQQPGNGNHTLRRLALNGGRA